MTTTTPARTDVPRLSPYHVFAAQAFRVHALNAVEADVPLGFGVSVRKIFTLYSLDITDVPTELRDAAYACLVACVRDQRRLLVVLMDASKSTSLYVPARVYVDERVTPPTPELLTTPFSVPPTEDRMELGHYMRWLMVRGFPVRDVHPVFSQCRRERVVG